MTTQLICPHGSRTYCNIKPLRWSANYIYLVIFLILCSKASVIPSLLELLQKVILIGGEISVLPNVDNGSGIERIRLVLIDASECLELDSRRKNLVIVICLYKYAPVGFDDKQDR
jgi:hypothetical protein